MHHDLLSVIEQISAASTPQETLRVMKACVSDDVEPEFAAINSLSRPDSTYRDVWMATDLREDWTEHCFREGFFEHDAALHQVHMTTDPFLWKQSMPTHDQTRWMKMVRDARDFGVDNGIMIPIPGMRGAVGNTWFSWRDSVPSKGIRIMRMASVYAFHHTQKLLGQLTFGPALTGREADILSWLAAGKTAWDIGEILHLSERTIQWHTQRAMRKLHACNNTQAVAIALTRGLISI